jgi:hypothetical protein
MRQLQPMAQNAMQVGCGSCGAIVNFTPPETARSCDFCGAKIVAQPKAADPLVAPEGVLPFSVTQSQAVGNYKTWLSSLWFAPSALKEMAQADKLSSIYIPYWTYDARTRSFYRGERGEYFYETERFYENGEQKERGSEKRAGIRFRARFRASSTTSAFPPRSLCRKNTFSILNPGICTS